jgi:hypothetical protein
VHNIFQINVYLMDLRLKYSLRADRDYGKTATLAAS